MPGESELHRTLKREACRWLHRMGYQSVAAEVRLRPLGIVDAAGVGIFRGANGHLGTSCEVSQVCFVECKATRSDFLRDCTRDGQMALALMERECNLLPPIRRASARLRQTVGLGKFAACLMQPMANLHYVLSPAGVIQKKDLPPRWGLLTHGPGGISVIVKPAWQESGRAHYVESAIARTLTADIFRADNRAIHSVNRELFNRQTDLAARLRSSGSQAILAPPSSEGIVAPGRELAEVPLTQNIFDRVE